MYKTKNKPIFRYIIAAALVIGSVFYLLADRYLIEHIEISNVNALAVVAERQATPQEITLVVSNTTSLTPILPSIAIITASVVMDQNPQRNNFPG